MAGYLIADIEVTDPTAYLDYIRAIGGSIHQYGGSVIINTRTIDVVEGETRRNLQVVVKFPTVEQTRAWYHSSEYAPAILLRQKASTGTLVIVEGKD